VEEPKFIISNNQTVVFAVAGETYSIGTSHPHYSEIVDAIKAQDWVSILPMVPDLPDKMRIHIGIYLDTFGLDGAL